MASNLGVQIKRPTSYPFGGRLIILGNLSNPLLQSPTGLAEGSLVISFPAMPETIELARQTDYMVVSNMVVPDGVHQYRWTAPLAIPFSFSLHSQDQDYCPDGALTLLRVAARLHALVLPVGDASVQVTVNNDAPLTQENNAPTATPNSGAPSPGFDANRLAKAASPNSPTFQTPANNRIDPPVACLLELMYTAQNEPGILCVGYVKDVKVVLKGPWLRGPGQAYNLPTSGEFSFTFIHRPGHSNNYSQVGLNPALAQPGQPQAYADLVRENLFRTSQLIKNTGNNYRGLGESLK
jgi:hypothetical protein